MEVTSTEFLKQASNTAEYFGFKSVDTVKKHPACRSCSKKLEHNASAQDRRIDSLHGMLTAGMNVYCESKFHEIEEPILFYTTELGVCQVPTRFQ